MRIKILALGFLYFYLVTAVSSAQIIKEETKEPATKLEAFLATKGKLLIKEFYELGKASGRYGAEVEFTAVVMFEPGEEDKRVRGLRITVTQPGTYEKSETSFLDIEEVNSLLKAIDYIVDLSVKWKDIEKEYTEIIFSTKGDFMIGFYQKGNKQAAFSSSGRIGKANCFFTSLEGLDSVKAITDKGLKLLNEK